MFAGPQAIGGPWFYLPKDKAVNINLKLAKTFACELSCVIFVTDSNL